MKKNRASILTLVLTIILVAVCGCTNRNTGSTSAPTVLPTNEENRIPASDLPTSPTVMTTDPSDNTSDLRPDGENTATEATFNNGNGPLTDSTGNGTRNRNSNLQQDMGRKSEVQNGILPSGNG